MQYKEFVVIVSSSSSSLWVLNLVLVVRVECSSSLGKFQPFLKPRKKAASAQKPPYKRYAGIFGRTYFCRDCKAVDGTIHF